MRESDKEVKRIQRKRTRGWRLPENTKCVDRSSRWGNPYRITLDAPDRKDAVESFERYVKAKPLEERIEWLRPLRGKDLACFCGVNQPCHADVLIQEIKNLEEMGVFDHAVEEIQPTNTGTR